MFYMHHATEKNDNNITSNRQIYSSQNYPKAMIIMPAINDMPEIY